MTIQVGEALRRALEAGRPPSFYLDTNVIRDLMRGRRQESFELFELLERKKWPCLTAYFTYTELFDIEQETSHLQTKLSEGMEINQIWRSRRARDLDQQTLRRIETDVYQVVQNKCGIVEWLYLDELGWNQAIDLASRSNLTAPDCIHLATALIAACDVLVTSDSHLSRNAKAYIASGPPEQVLKEIGLLSR